MGSASTSAKAGSTPAAVQWCVMLLSRSLSMVIGTSSTEHHAHMTDRQCQLNMNYIVLLLKWVRLELVLRVRAVDQVGQPERQDRHVGDDAQHQQEQKDEGNDALDHLHDRRVGD